VPLQFGPNIKDWPQMIPLTEDILLQIVSEIHDPVTTTDELIPSGETSSYRSNPLGLAEFTLSRKDPEYVARAKEVRKAEETRRAGGDPTAENPSLEKAMEQIRKEYPEWKKQETGIGSAIYAVKPGDGSAREQAASCQRVLGGLANIAKEYATKRYRSNLINWGMLPLLFEEEQLPFANLDYLFIPRIRRAIVENASEIQAYVVKDTLIPVTLKMRELTEDERQIILDGCLINFYK
jgi:aconitate hydratase